MTLLTDLVDAIDRGAVQVIDLTAPLTEQTPILVLPEPLGQTVPFQLTEISRYNESGPLTYWNNFTTGEHTGTHFDAPVHWVTGRGGDDVSQVPLRRLVAPAAVLDCRAQAAADPDFLLELDHIRAWEQQHGPLPPGGWLLVRSGWDTRSRDSVSYLNSGHTPGFSVDCARWLAEQAPVIGVGVETVGTDAGSAGEFDPPYPCHALLLGADKYGLTQLQNLALLPPTGAVVVASPLPIVGGSGSPTRVLALVEP